MTSGTVRERLRYAVGVHASATPARPAPLARSPADLAEALRGEWHESAAGPVFVRDEWFSLDHLHGALPLRSALDAAPDALAHLVQLAEAPPVARLAFFDIETTGLSGGAGTYIVLAGLGSYELASPGEAPAFRMRQYFLADLAHERAMLSLLADDLARFEGLVTYNGRSFDIPFVQTRLTLARVPYPCAGLPHFDLLHIVRRLYRHRMPACRLADAERRLLRIDRPDDVPGSLIPAIYFEYLLSGRVSALRGVFRHNADDVLSLVGVLARAAALLGAAPKDPDDAVAVARWWEHAGDAGRAADLYRFALPWLEGGDDWTWAAIRYARLCRRAGQREEAARLWRKLWAGGHRPSGIDLAKHLEHHLRDFCGAVEVIETLLRGAQEPERQEFSQRLERVRRKLRTRASA